VKFIGLAKNLYIMIKNLRKENSYLGKKSLRKEYPDEKGIFRKKKDL